MAKLYSPKQAHLDHYILVASSSGDAGRAKCLDEALLRARFLDLAIDFDVRHANWVWELLVKIGRRVGLQGSAFASAEACGDVAPSNAASTGTLLGTALCTARARVHTCQEINILACGVSLRGQEVDLLVAICLINAPESRTGVLGATDAWGELECNSVCNAGIMENLFQCWREAPAGRSFRTEEELKGGLVSGTDCSSKSGKEEFTEHGFWNLDRNKS